MVVPLFGWSVGDVVTSIKILYAIAGAFKDATGAGSQFAETSIWLESFASDLKRVTEYTSENPNARYTKNMIEQVARINDNYAVFEKYLQKYEKGLSSTAEANMISAAVKKVKWALKELKGKVDSMKFAVTGPLVSINMLLALQSLYEKSLLHDNICNFIDFV